MKQVFVGKAGMGTLAFALLLSACNGGTPMSVTPSGANFNPSAVQGGAAGLAIPQAGPGQCGNPPMQISPSCFIQLKRGSKMVQITIKTPPGNIVERNNCRKGRGRGKFRHRRRDVAGVHGGGDNWTATAGDHRGFCKATFYFKATHGPDASTTIEIENLAGHRHRRF